MKHAISTLSIEIERLNFIQQTEKDESWTEYRKDLIDQCKKAIKTIEHQIIDLKECGSLNEDTDKIIPICKPLTSNIDIDHCGNNFSKDDLEKAFDAGWDCSVMHNCGSCEGAYDDFDIYYKDKYLNNEDRITKRDK